MRTSTGFRAAASILMTISSGLKHVSSLRSSVVTVAGVLRLMKVTDLCLTMLDEEDIVGGVVHVQQKFMKHFLSSSNQVSDML